MNRRNGKRKKTVGLIFMLPSLIGVICILVIPYINVIFYAFINVWNRKFVGFDNFKRVILNDSFQLAAYNSLKFIVTCIPILLVLSLIIAVYLHEHVAAITNTFKSIFLFPLSIPVVSIVLLWRLLFDDQGFLNGIFNTFSIKGVDWINSKYSFGILVFSYLWKNLGYSIVLWLAGLSTIPKQIYEAARVDGAGDKECFCYITLPNLRSTLFVTMVISIINSFKIFREAYLLAGDYPNKSIYMLQHLFNNWFRDLDIEKMSAGATLLSIILLVPIVALYKCWNTKE
ncbi:multiple sugar transport system permease protein [Aequitasia blattaphilus]|uniref:Sugar ABC transporter permease n=1 Tax=Aequitasia blattaphilus TaxID=2949332 RepID=A0ABT1EAB9_9FIRM|nr:sugar ABC transporter permease [Aequitasia blattaphilus]MCP1101452.1 sugar ABC transporter permease [Aequitasia blattaphilus]MCR8614092.1 sugar ABC transporter permease [Aequitasia blattaphilus]